MVTTFFVLIAQLTTVTNAITTAIPSSAVTARPEFTDLIRAMMPDPDIEHRLSIVSLAAGFSSAQPG